MDEIFALFAEEATKQRFHGSLAGWVCQGGPAWARVVTSASLSASGQAADAPFATFARPGRLEESAVNLAAGLVRPVLLPAVQTANRINYRRGSRSHGKDGDLRSLVPFTYWPGSFFSGYPALLPQGIETFQAFVPEQAAPTIFKEVLRYSQQQGCMPLWCVIKKHRRDPFLLSYQVDGFSLELNYARTGQPVQQLQPVLQHMIATVIDAGGRFYPAKDHFQTAAQYRQSVGEAGG